MGLVTPGCNDAENKDVIRSERKHERKWDME